MTQYADEAAAFDRSRACFEAVVAELAGPSTSGQTHAQLEDFLHHGKGRELLRTLMQDRMDLQTVREQRQQVVDGEGVARTRVERGHQRGLATVLGQVTATRMAYRAPATPNLYPADAAWSLPTGKHSHGLRRLTALESARGSFADGADAIWRATGVRIGKRQVEALAQAAAVDVVAFYTARRPGPAPEHLLVMQFDGKGIVMIPKALREATAKAAAQAERKLRTRLSPGEKNGRKRMAEVAAVYDAVPAPRTADDIITRGTTASRASRKRGPNATGKWLTASVTHDIPTVISAGFDEAGRRDPTSQRTWVVLVDGNRTQIEAIQAEANRRAITVHIVVDFIHVVEYLWKAAAGSDRGALPGSLPVGFPDPPAEPAVRLITATGSPCVLSDSQPFDAAAGFSARECHHRAGYAVDTTLLRAWTGGRQLACRPVWGQSEVASSEPHGAPNGHRAAPVFTGASSDLAIPFLSEHTAALSHVHRLSLARSTTAAPSHPRLRPASRLSPSLSLWLRAGIVERTRMVPTFTAVRLTG
jgi:hypothetical protein